MSDAAGKAGGATILVAEDDATVREFIRRALSEAGHTVLDAANAQAALTVASQHETSIDVLLADVVMPDMDGRELSRRIKRLRPGLRTLFISGQFDRDFDLGLAAGQKFLAKPFTGEQLMRQLHATLAAPVEMSTPISTPILRA